jgi:hypothetical protein
VAKNLSRPYHIFDGFYPHAKAMRAHFDQRFEDPLRSSRDRFVWDYWHVPGEYTLLRTPAYTYFPRSQYERFHRHLVRWGREVLGCHDVSPPWLSCYIEGCRQHPHQDVPHGPLAFVYSLTPKRRQFRGGETFLRQPRTLIAPEFNRLTVFNPSLVHGVRPIKGTHDPRHGRLVIHGWFVNPRPFWVGPLTIDDVRTGIEDGLEDLPAKLGGGLLSLRLRLKPSGHVAAVEPLIQTLSESRDLQKFLNSVRNDWRFPAHKRGSTVTLPLVFV